jgi:hypothetical protein
MSWVAVAHSVLVGRSTTLFLTSGSRTQDSGDTEELIKSPPGDDKLSLSYANAED